MATPATPDAALRLALRRDGSRPLVTWYDLATGARVELSVATLANAVAKTANLLVDELDVAPGDRIRIALPLHWQVAVWLGACWACGAVAVPVVPGAAAVAPAAPQTPDEGAGTAVAVIGPDDLPRPPAARDVVAVSLDPLGGPFRSPLPPGVLDHAVESRTQADVFTAALPPGHDDAGLVTADGALLTLGQVMARSQEVTAAQRIPAAGRLLSALPPTTEIGVLAALAMPLAVEGSVVLVQHPDTGSLDTVTAAERIDRVVSDG